MSKIITVSEAKALPASDVSKMFVSACEAGRVAYLVATNALIALIGILGSTAKAKAQVKKDGAKDSDVRNALILVGVYDALVVPGHVTEAWFADVRYMDAWHIGRAIDKIGAKKLVADGVFKGGVMNAVTKCELVVTPAKKTVKKAAEPIVAPIVEPAVTEGNEIPAAVPAANVEPIENGKTLTDLSVKGPSNGLTELEEKFATVQKIAVMIISKGDEVASERIQDWVAALDLAVNTAVKTVAKAKKSA